MINNMSVSYTMKDISREIEDNLNKLIKTLKYTNWSHIPISVKY